MIFRSLLHKFVLTFNFAQNYFTNELYTVFLTYAHTLIDFINLTYINIFYVKRLEKHISSKQRIPLNHGFSLQCSLSKVVSPSQGSLSKVLSLQGSLSRVFSRGFQVTLGFSLQGSLSKVLSLGRLLQGYWLSWLPGNIGTTLGYQKGILCPKLLNSQWMFWKSNFLLGMSKRYGHVLEDKIHYLVTNCF